MISFCGKKITDSDVLDVYGLISGERIVELAKAIGTMDYSAIVHLVDTYAGEGRDLFRVLLDLQAHMRKVLLEDCFAKKSW